MKSFKQAYASDRALQRKMIMFNNLTNYGMIDMMEHQFDRYNKLNFGSYKFIWQKWIRK